MIFTSSHFSIFLYFFYFLNNVNSYNYLIISPAFGFSHMRVMAKLAHQLADAGHNVTYFQPFVKEDHIDKKLIKNEKIEVINYFHDEEGRKHLTDGHPLEDAWYSYKYESSVGAAIITPKVLFASFEHMCRTIFQDTQLHEVLKSRNFDVVFSETFDFCGLYLADYLKFPSIISIFTGSQLLVTRAALGEPSLQNYLPSPFANYGKDATIFDRFKDLFFHFFEGFGFSQLFDKQFEQINQLTNGKVNDWKKIMNKVSFHFINSNPFLDFVTPTIPKVVSVGGFAIDYSNVLPVDEKLNKILNQRNKTIFVSFGSVIRSIDMPINYKESMLKIFELNRNVTFLWKYENPEEEFLKNKIPENVLLEKWFPQQSLLADKRVNLFITHGGLGSVMELAYAAKPAIVVPIFADQPMNAKALVRQKTAIFYSKHEIPNWKKLNQLINEMLTNESYQKHANRLSEILNDPPVKPQHLVLRYSENAAKFGRIETLTPFITEMSFVAKFNLDIYLILISSMIVFGYFLLKILKKIILVKKTKNKSD